MNNKGFSLVEMVITIAILAACTALVTLSLSVIPSSAAKKCANELDELLSDIKLQAMTRDGGAYLRLYVNDKGETVAETYIGGTDSANLSDSAVIGNRRCSVSVNGSFAADDGTSSSATTPLSSLSAGLWLSFKRDTGALSFTQYPANAIQSVSALTVSGGTRTYTITLYAATGAHAVKMEVTG